MIQVEGQIQALSVKYIIAICSLCIILVSTAYQKAFDGCDTKRAYKPTAHNTVVDVAVGCLVSLIDLVWYM